MSSIFFDFQKLNGTTWLYLSALLTLSVFFRFSRFFSLRNWDIVTLFLLAPGLLATIRVDRELLGVARDPEAASQLSFKDQTKLELIRKGYIWLFVATGYLTLRAIVDLSLIRRPRIDPNLNIEGLACLGVSLLGFLMYEVMVKDPDPAGRESAKIAAQLLRGEGASAETTPVKGTAAVLSTPVIAVHTAVAKRLDRESPNELPEIEIGVARSMTILSHQLILAALVLIGWKHFESLSTGISMATFYLVVPINAMNVEKIDHLAPASLLVWAVFAYRSPWITGALFGLAGLFVFPLFLVPLWLGFYGRRGAWRFLASFVCVAGVVWLAFFWVAPLRSFMEAWNSAVAWKAWDFHQSPESLGFWTPATQSFRLPVCILFAFGAVVAPFWPARKSLAELIALSAALVLGVQLWYADRGGAYVHWYLPLVILMIFRPSLSGKGLDPTSSGANRNFPTSV